MKNRKSYSRCPALLAVLTVCSTVLFLFSSCGSGNGKPSSVGSDDPADTYRGYLSEIRRLDHLTAKELAGHLKRWQTVKDSVFARLRRDTLGLPGSDACKVCEGIHDSLRIEFSRLALSGPRTYGELLMLKERLSPYAADEELRRAAGIFSILNIRENTVISSLKKHRRGIWLSNRSMKKDTQWSIDAMHTKTPSQETKIRSLSGGNQQKVILGRWLLTDPDVLLLDEPTRGIDVGAKYEIYQLIIDLANRGKTVLMVSSEMPELLGVCDRILVMSGGRLAGEVDAKTTSQEEIMRLAAKYV